ncbi:hypothetical protein NC653_037801 [Populus alba x Populus x berolinensis]|uniref:Uncharacterized protein n=1 Tax=Populus alba x Populus x berolinensis TaxID=444605 RepID=A0AAD6PSG8_9ROSI|nr:hypothetical protein NC653_037801 [Populus alba x Populus x berolinensis]
MQQNKKLKKDVDFPIEKQGTSDEKLMSKMHKFNSMNARISGMKILKSSQSKAPIVFAHNPDNLSFVFHAIHAETEATQLPANQAKTKKTAENRRQHQLIHAGTKGPRRFSSSMQRQTPAIHAKTQNFKLSLLQNKSQNIPSAHPSNNVDSIQPRAKEPTATHKLFHARMWKSSTNHAEKKET